MGDTVKKGEFESPVYVGREHGSPWYQIKDLQARNLYDTPTGEPLSAEQWDALGYINEEFDHDFSGELISTGFVIVRTLPEDTYVPPDYVLACLTASIEWGRALDVSWMQMEMQEHRGVEVPVQQHRKGAVVMFIEDDARYFGVASPEDITEPVRVQTDCITDIRLCPPPEPVKTSQHRQKDGTLVLFSHVRDEDMLDEHTVKASEPYVLDDGTKVPVYLCDDGSTFTPIVALLSEQDVIEQQFDAHAGLNDYLSVGTEAEVLGIERLRNAGDPQWRELAAQVIRRHQPPGLQTDG